MRIDEYINGLEKSANEQFEKDKELQLRAGKDLEERTKKIEAILSEERKKLEEQYGIPTLRAVRDKYIFRDGNEFGKKLKSFKIDTSIKEVLNELQQVTGEEFTPQVYISEGFDNAYTNLEFKSPVVFKSKSHKFVISPYYFQSDDELVEPEQLSILGKKPRKRTIMNFTEAWESRFSGENYYEVNLPAEAIPQLPLHITANHILDFQRNNQNEDAQLFFQALTNIYERKQSAEKSKSSTGGKDDK